MKKLIIFILILAGSITAHANKPEDTRYPFQATLYGGLGVTQEPAWSLEPNISWNFLKYFGVSLGIELTSQFGNSTRSTIIEGHQAWLTDNQVNPAWIIFKPSLILRTPDIWHSRDRYIRLWLQGEPGIIMGTPFHNSLTYEISNNPSSPIQAIKYRKFKNEGLQWFYFGARLSANIAIDRYVIGAGYSISTLDYYSGRRNVILADGTKFHVPHKQPFQTVFLSIGYMFGSIKPSKPKYTATPADFIFTQ